MEIVNKKCGAFLHLQKIETEHNFEMRKYFQVFFRYSLLGFAVYLFRIHISVI